MRRHRKRISPSTRADGLARSCTRAVDIVESILTDEDSLYVDIHGFLLQHFRQLVEIQLPVAGLAVEPVVPAFHVVVRANQRLEG